MPQFSTLALGMALTVLGSQAGPTKRPMLAGEWAVDQKFLSSEDPPPPVCDRKCVITQSPETLTVRIGSRTTTYRLDGVETKRVLQVGEYSPQVRSTATWDTDALILRTTVTIEDSVRDTRSRLTIKEGRLVIENTVLFDSRRTEKRYEYASVK